MSTLFATSTLQYNTKQMERLRVFPKDIGIITGLKDRSAQKLLQEIKISLKKEKHQFITKHELAKYLGIDANLIRLK